MLSIDIITARRFILGKQGLWPGRRWRGIEGAEQAMRAIEYLQLDPLQIMARSQDIQLHCRVLYYTPNMWEDLAYQQRKFFDWGGWLAVRPMDELPHWRVVMHRERDGDYGDPRIRSMARDHAEAIAEMRAILHERGAVSNRDFEMATRKRTQSYRGRKDSALALYYLWRTGEIPGREQAGCTSDWGAATAPRRMLNSGAPFHRFRLVILDECPRFFLPPAGVCGARRCAGRCAAGARRPGAIG